MRWFGKTEEKQDETASPAGASPKTMPPGWRPSLPPVGAAPTAPAVAGAASAPAPVRIGGAAAAVAAPSVRLGAQRSAPPSPREPQPPGQKTLYKQLMNGFYDAILIADGKGHIVESNIRAPEFFGFSNDELWDMQASSLIAGLNEGVYDRIRNAIGGERHVLMNTRCTRKDGSHFPAEVGISVIAMLGKDDFVFTVRNVERRAAQLRSLRSGQNAFMNSLAGCFVCDAARHVVTVNNAFMTTLRLVSSVPVVGVPIDQFIPSVEMHFDRVAAGETIVFQSTMTLGGVDRTLTISLTPNRQGTSQIDGVVGSILPAAPAEAKP